MGPKNVLGYDGAEKRLEMTAEMECKRENNSEPTKKRDNHRKFHSI